ncbi:hypothetical protein PV11_04768 [Exophiala sideris]|uniref:Fe2OG dioxygenase domain-containing protein n=1 Tax=Exophiala sideris TaxID=1016849 RepID=A0A0D1YNE1_9EURO|nr:hypothetical protein PV11_04768 [Exophiala sideris]
MTVSYNLPADILCPSQHAQKAGRQTASNSGLPLFQPDQDFCFEPPKAFATLKELLLSEEDASSPLAITDPFPLFTPEAVEKMRADVFRREVVDKYGQRTMPRCFKLRGYSKDTPYVDSVWRHELVVKACSQAAGVDLAVVFDYEIGQVNAQYDAITDDKPLSDTLPPAKPLLYEAAESPSETSAQQDEPLSLGVWHKDAYPWVCVVMLSNPTNMVGGETGIRRGDGVLAKYRGPQMGWAVMMQGGCIDHIALQGLGTGERVTMVTSFRPKSPLVKDTSDVAMVIYSSLVDELFTQWTVYRLQVLTERTQASQAKIAAGGMSEQDIAEAVAQWNKEQIEYMTYTASQMSAQKINDAMARRKTLATKGWTFLSKQGLAKTE